MAESSKEELLQLIKRFGAYLTVKMSSLFPISLHNLNSRSIGAIAGFAVAIVFTWRLLRPPSGPQRRQPKRQAPASSSSGISSNSNATLTTPGVSSSEDSRTQNVVDEFFQPVKPTLGQIVRQKLSEGRKVTCRLLGVILEESTPEELQKQVTVRYSVLEVLLEITKFCDLYLMERVLDDESERKVLMALEDAGIFTSGGLVRLTPIVVVLRKRRASKRLVAQLYIYEGAFTSAPEVLCSVLPSQHMPEVLRLIMFVLLFTKFCTCRHYNNAFYARVGGVSNAELNKLELELLFLLDFGVTVSSRDFESYCFHLEKENLQNGACRRIERPLLVLNGVDDVPEIPENAESNSLPPQISEATLSSSLPQIVD